MDLISHRFSVRANLSKTEKKTNIVKNPKIFAHHSSGVTLVAVIEKQMIQDAEEIFIYIQIGAIVKKPSTDND